MASRLKALQKMTLESKMFQVWAGTDACEPVTWQECELVAKKVKFIVPEMNIDHCYEMLLIKHDQC